MASCVVLVKLLFFLGLIVCTHSMDDAMIEDYKYAPLVNAFVSHS